MAVVATESLERRRFTATEVLRMVEAGILGEDEPLELLEGELVVTPPQGPPHAAAVSDLDDRLREVYKPACHVRTQCPLEGASDSLPEPDLAVVRGKPRDFTDRHPNGADVVLVIEVARTSQALDRRKARAYALIGVPVYWLLDLAARRLEVHSDPSAEGEYLVTNPLGEGESVPLPGTSVSWNVSSLFP